MSAASSAASIAVSGSVAPIHGLHHFAWRCRDAEETRHFYEDLLGLPLAHVIKADIAARNGVIHGIDAVMLPPGR